MTKKKSSLFWKKIIGRHNQLPHRVTTAISYKPLVGISPNLKLWCSWWRRWIGYIPRSKGQRL